MVYNFAYFLKDIFNFHLETERAINLLKFYKSQLNKSEEKSLRKAMEKLVETLEAPLFGALLGIFI